MHHAFARAVDGRVLFVDDEDFERYIRLLGFVAEQYEWRCLGFCLMPNHVHLLVETPQANLGAGMQWLHSRYALLFNEAHGRQGRGHVFQGPYGSKVVRDDLYLLRVAAYVLMNAVAAGLCRKPGEWPWCSHGLVERGIAPSWMRHDLLWERLVGITGRSDPLSTVVL